MPSVDPDVADALARVHGSRRGEPAPANAANAANATNNAATRSNDPRDAGAGTTGSDGPPGDAGRPSAEQPETSEPSNTPSVCDGFAILQANCGMSGCHGGTSALGNFAASEAAARSYIGKSGALGCAASGPLIDPEDPSASVLVRKLSDDPPCGSSSMPPTGVLLPESDVECIEEWIGSLE